MSELARDLLRRHLQQRRELGELEVVLEGVTAVQVHALLTGGPAAVADRSAAVEPPVARPARAPEAPPREAPSPAHRAPSTPLVSISTDAIRMLPTLDAVREVALGCPRCRLAETRQQVVFGEGNPSADVLVVGEAPGADEDRTGRPFVGRAGKLLDLLLGSAGFARETVYICNVLKCRPPGNRNPQPDEVECCNPYLVRQVELIQPRVIVAFGNFAAQTLLGTDVSIGKLRSTPAELRFRDVPVIPTYHPAALLRNPGWVRAVWDDLQRVRGVLDRID